MTRTSTRMNVNQADFIGLPVFVVASAVALGLLDSTLMGFDLSRTVLDLGSGHGFSVANTLAIATLAYVAYTNHWEWDMFDTIQMWVVAATIGLLVAPPFMPVLADTLAQTPAALAAFALQMWGFISFSYLG